MKKIVLILFLCFGYSYLYGQISTHELPVSWNMQGYSLESSIPEITLPHLDFNKLANEDLQDDKNGYPPRFGDLQQVNLNLLNSGVWTELPNKGRLWRLEIYSPDALSLNLLYDKFYLPDGAKFFVYASDKTHSIGAFTNINNKDDRKFTTGLVYSNRITVEYFEPLECYKLGDISISYIVSGYRNIILPDYARTVESFGNSGNCQVNINCEEGNDWQQEKVAVALILVNGNRYCTGSLINTTENNYEPLLLTADHCLGGWANSYDKHDAITNPDLSHYSFYWMYEAPGCARATESPKIISTSGAKVIANSSTTDFALLKLIEDPKDIGEFTPYYAGWDSRNIITGGGVGIHHPVGDTKKIATYTQTPITSDNYFWKLNWVQTLNGYSVTEGGSSGSALFNNSHRIIGQLWGGSSVNCSNPALDYAVYGKLCLSWDGISTSDSRRRLRDWLDPKGILPISGGICDGRFYACQQITDIEISDKRSFEGDNLFLKNVIVYKGANVILNGYNSVSIVPGFKAELGSNVRIYNGFAPNKEVRAIISESNMLEEEDMLSDEYLAILDQNTPNPASSMTTISIVIPEFQKNAYIQLYDMVGSSVMKIPINTIGSSIVGINTLKLVNGIYVYSLIVDDCVVDTKRMIVVN